MTTTYRLAAFAACVLLGWLFVIARTPPARGDGLPDAACARDPQGQPVHCRCLHSKPQGMPVADPASCPPAPVVIVDCVDPSGAPCPGPTTSSSVYVPTAADVNDAPAEPVLGSPGFTG